MGPMCSGSFSEDWLVFPVLKILLAGSDLLFDQEIFISSDSQTTLGIRWNFQPWKTTRELKYPSQGHMATEPWYSCEFFSLPLHRRYLWSSELDLHVGSYHGKWSGALKRRCSIWIGMACLDHAKKSHHWNSVGTVQFGESAPHAISKILSLHLS